MAGGIHFRDAAGPPGMRLYAIGDVHGCFDLLTDLHEQIRAEIDAERPEDWRIIHVGDYVDRGPDSRGVIDFLWRATTGDPRMIALAGNHDVGLLDFMADPQPEGLFAGNGGAETARSYGVSPDFTTRSGAQRTADGLRAAMPQAHVEFLGGLPRSASFGDFFFCHAGVRPGVALDRQDPQDLIWIRERFLNWPGLYEKIVVHGHTPANPPELLPNRINVDTGAFKSGVLTALAVNGGEKRILQADAQTLSAKR